MNPTRAARHGLTLAWRSLLKLRHSPDQLLDVVLLPITFVLVFVFLFGKAVAGDWHAYLQFVLPGKERQRRLGDLLHRADLAALTVEDPVAVAQLDQLELLPDDEHRLGEQRRRRRCGSPLVHQRSSLDDLSSTLRLRRLQREREEASRRQAWGVGSGGAEPEVGSPNPKRDAPVNG
jgi:hypothetical protein